MSGWLDRTLALPGTDEVATLERKAQALRILLLVNVTANHALVGAYGRSAALGACLVAVLFPRTARLAMGAAFLILAELLYQAFPVYANHNFLQLLLVGLGCLLQPRRVEDQTLFLQASRWVVVCAFFWSGLKKVMFGHYFDGEYLAFLMARTPRFAGPLRWLIPDADAERLAGSEEILLGAGPYHVDSAVFVALSNAVYLSELLVAVLLLWRRTRPFAWLLGVAVVVGIEVVARELMFGMLCVTLFLCFSPGDRLRRFLPWALGIYAAGLAMHYGWLPGWWIN